MNERLSGRCVWSVWSLVNMHHTWASERLKKVKVAHTRLPRVGFWGWSRFLAVSLQLTWLKPGVTFHQARSYPQSLRALLPILLFGTRQCCGCDFNPGPTAPESSMLTTRLPSHWETVLVRICVCRTVQGKNSCWPSTTLQHPQTVKDSVWSGRLHVSCPLLLGDESALSNCTRGLIAAVLVCQCQS